MKKAISVVWLVGILVLTPSTSAKHIGQCQDACTVERTLCNNQADIDYNICRDVVNESYQICIWQAQEAYQACMDIIPNPGWCHVLLEQDLNVCAQARESEMNFFCEEPRIRAQQACHSRYMDCVDHCPPE